MAFSDNAKAVIALTTRLGDGSRPSLSPTRWHQFSTALADAGLRLAEVFAPDFDPALPGVPDDLANFVHELLRTAPAATVAAADLENKGIWTLTLADVDYPTVLSDRLGKLAPPVIFGVGPTPTLMRRGIAIVGSRNVSEEGAKVAADFARAAVEAGHTVVSGGGRGVDQFALNAAFSSGGRVVAMIADSLQARIRSPDILRALDSGNTTLVSQEAPEAPLRPESAKARNKLIYAMSEVTVVIASGVDSGESWSGAAEALRARNGVVAVWLGPGEGPGNARLVELGAVAMRSPDDLLGYLDANTSIPEQLSLPHA
ncbi:MAG: hypothetical protein HKN07_14275 [Acidimicrobiia bacterium]|nr:hypothetical protein [Acidimicrobiia bacterium]